MALSMVSHLKANLRRVLKAGMEGFFAFDPEQKKMLDILVYNFNKIPPEDLKVINNPYNPANGAFLYIASGEHKEVVWNSEDNS